MTEEEKNLIEEIVKKIKTLRKEADVSQRIMYYDTELNMGRIETGVHDIKITTLKKICDYFGISLSDFFTDID